MIRAGAKILQLRAKDHTTRFIYELTLELEELCGPRGVCLILNDKVDVACVTDRAGVHLGQEDFPAEQARTLLETRTIGLSTHNAAQFVVANQMPVDYIAIGPVYRTTTKQTFHPNLGMSGITPLLEGKSKPVVAIGGIRRQNIKELLSAGVDGIAMISELYRGGDLYKNAVQIIEQIR